MFSSVFGFSCFSIRSQTSFRGVSDDRRLSALGASEHNAAQAAASGIITPQSVSSEIDDGTVATCASVGLIRATVTSGSKQKRLISDLRGP